MAVIVQEMVDADVSGVAFTSDPTTGLDDRVVLESCFGLGETLVAGRVAPDRMVVSKDTFRVLERDVGHKLLRTALADAGGVVQVSLPDEHASRPSLDEAAASRIAKLAVTIERAFDAPQDVEWAVCEDQVYVLQSRRITTDVRATSVDDRQVWSNMNTGEILPDVICPMTWSLLEPAIHTMIGTLCDKIGVDVRKHRLLTRIAGRAYFNVNFFLGMIRLNPNGKVEDLTLSFGGAQGKLFESGQLPVRDEDIPDLRCGLPTLLMKLPGLVISILRYLPKKGERAFRRLREESRALIAMDLSRLTEPALIEHLRSITEGLLDSLHLFGFAVGAIQYYATLDGICRAWLDDEQGTMVNTLLTGVGGMDTAEAGLAFWRLAACARQYPQVVRALEDASDFEGIREKLRDLEGGQAFLDCWDGFMADHGHHTRGEVELFNPRWSETPDYVLGVVRNHLHNFEAADLVARHEEQRMRRLEFAAECRRRLRNPIKRAVFNRVLSFAQIGSQARENLKSEFIRRFSVVRYVVLNLGERLEDRGVLESPEDVFFLHLDEVFGLSQDARDTDWAALIQSRRAEYERNLMLTPPPVVVGTFDAEECGAAGSGAGVEILTGLAVSPGVAVGRAHVILHADTDEQVAPGEILVAPFTDPGWTPYFPTAAGIVMDMGGLLSHGSIVAREYGIPAVVNVGPATKILKTGQTLRVDGNLGIVRILEPP